MTSSRFSPVPRSLEPMSIEGVFCIGAEVHGGFVVYRTLDYREIIAEIAGPMQPGAQDRWFAKAARRCGLSIRQVEALWRRETTDPKTSVTIKVLEAAEKARIEASELASRFESLAGAMNASDSDFYGSDVLALIDAARALRGLDRA